MSNLPEYLRLQPMSFVSSAKVPQSRVRQINRHAVSKDGAYVLYWMTSFRRTRFNYALQRAVEWANELGVPLVVFEALRCNYRWASDRFHQFILESMLDTASSIIGSNATYSCYVEPSGQHGAGLLEKLAKQACVVVSDDFPCFFLPALYRSVSNKLSCAMELVDSNGVFPIRSTERIFTVAHSFRRHLQKELVKELPVFPVEEPLELLLAPGEELSRTLVRTLEAALRQHGATHGEKAISYLKRSQGLDFPIDRTVRKTEVRGGEVAASESFQRFLQLGLNRYDQDRNHPDRKGASKLSSYLHFGNLSAHEMLLAIAKREDWNRSKMAVPNGKGAGFWGMSHNAEAFIDQLIVWRELGFNMAALHRSYDRYESLPDWALETLELHADDPRPYVYTFEVFEQAKTHDPIWNAAQRELVQEGGIHNYLRMLWGKKILHWSRTPQEALRTIVELNNKYALDGRDPKSYSGIFWILGRYDRAWGPERSIFGKVRYMTSESTVRKIEMKEYLKRFGSF